MLQDGAGTTINERATARPSWHFPVFHFPNAGVSNLGQRKRRLFA